MRIVWLHAALSLSGTPGAATLDREQLPVARKPPQKPAAAAAAAIQTGAATCAQSRALGARAVACGVWRAVVGQRQLSVENRPHLQQLQVFLE